MKRSALLVLLVVLFAALAFLVAHLASTTPQIERANEPAPTADDRSGSALALDADGAHDPLAERTVLADAANSKNAELSSGADFGDALELRVVAKSTGLPVPKAEVFYLRAPPALQFAAQETPRYLGEILRVVEASGTRLEADDEGRVGLPWPDGRVFVVGRAQRLCGVVQVDRTSRSPVLLELHEDASITVQVVDSAGTPRAGVPVALRARRALWFDDVITALTDGEEGLAVLPHAGLAAGLNDNGRVCAAIAAVLEPPVEVDLDLARVSSKPIQLVLPRTGEVEVWLKRRDGSVWSEDAEVGLLCIPRGADPRISMPFRKDTSVRVRTRNGRALFTHVAVGGTLEASAVRPGLGTESRVEARGPMAGGERVTLVLTLDADPTMPTIEGRAVDELGAPLTSTELLARRVTGNSAPASGWTTKVRTDKAGVFQIEMVWESFDAGQVGFILARTSGELVLGDCARIQAPAELTPGIHKIGDVVITSGPLLASGVVMRSDGVPVARAEVTLSAQQDDDWSAATFATVITDAAGRFELRGCVDATRLRVIVHGPGLGTAAIDADPGTSGLRVTLSPAGAIAGSLIVGGLVKPSDVFVTCSIPGSAAHEGIWRWPEIPRPDGSFMLRGLDAGTYRVVLTTRAGSETVLEVEDVRVVAGETTSDPRLHSVDLTQGLFACELAVFGPDGRPLSSEFSVISRPSGNVVDAETRHNWSQNGTLRIVSVHEAHDVTIDAEGLRRMRFDQVKGHRDIRMQPGIPVRVALRGEGQPPQLPFFLQPVLVSQSDEELVCGWFSAPFDAAGQTRVIAPAAGTYRVSVGVGRGRFFRGTVWVEIDPPQDVVIKEAPGEQAIEIKLDPRAIETAVGAYTD